MLQLRDELPHLYLTITHRPPLHCSIFYCLFLILRSLFPIRPLRTRAANPPPLLLHLGQRSGSLSPSFAINHSFGGGDILGALGKHSVFFSGGIFFSSLQ